MADLVTHLMEVTHVIHQMNYFIVDSELILDVTEFSIGDDTQLFR